jgi:serine/threonine protein kinase
MTRKYCSPETAQAGLRGRKADIFSMGCVFLEMFSFLIYDREPNFKEFQEVQFVGDRAYQENLRMVREWVDILRGQKLVKVQPILQLLLDSCEAMLEESTENRPTAMELSATLPPSHCCLSPGSASYSPSTPGKRMAFLNKAEIPTFENWDSRENAENVCLAEEGSRAGTNKQRSHCNSMISKFSIVHYEQTQTAIVDEVDDLRKKIRDAHHMTPEWVFHNPVTKLKYCYVEWSGNGNRICLKREGGPGKSKLIQFIHESVKEILESRLYLDASPARADLEGLAQRLVESVGRGATFLGNELFDLEKVQTAVLLCRNLPRHVAAFQASSTTSTN